MFLYTYIICIRPFTRWPSEIDFDKPCYKWTKIQHCNIYFENIFRSIFTSSSDLESQETEEVIEENKSNKFLWPEYDLNTINQRALLFKNTMFLPNNQINK